MLAQIHIEPMRPSEWDAVAELIRISTNHWYETHGHGTIFTGPAEATRLFCEVYEALDPGCCLTARNSSTGELAGSCFYHPRPTHYSLGIMNVHPNSAGQGVARRLLQEILSRAEEERKTVRLVSSAMNLDSFSLYTRAGFTPHTTFHDMVLPVPAEGLHSSAGSSLTIREGTLQDAERIAQLEQELVFIHRPGDYRFFLQNQGGMWHTSIAENSQGKLQGFLVSIVHPGCAMLGPGVMRTPEAAEALICAELNFRHPHQPVFLVPAHCLLLVKAMYRLGARNCELHFAQAYGNVRAPAGIVMPTFMPETG